jgi:hypothetical protein
MKPNTKASPFWYAVGGLFATPAVVLILLLGAIAFTLALPLIPFLLYFQRRAELSKEDGE